LFDQSGTSKATQNPAEIARIQAEVGSEFAGNRSLPMREFI
jgi:hypothetical protein